MKRVKKILMEAAKRDREAIMNTDSFEKLLALIAEREKTQNEEKAANKNSLTDKPKTMVCPDCGSALNFKPEFGRFMHENSEQLNCWFQADELGNYVDNNKMRAERIAKFNGENFNETKMA